MSFVISELVVEQVLRNGLEDMKTEIDIALDDIFHNLSSDLLNSKYSEDYEKIKMLLLNSQIAVLHAFPNVDTQLPSYTIHLQNDSEEIGQDVLGDYAAEETISIDPTIVLDNLSFISYDGIEKVAYVSDSVDLSQVYYNRWLVLSDNTEIQIVEANNTIGNKYIKLNTDLQVITMSGNKIVSAIDSRVFRQHEIPSREVIMIGVHSQNSLLTKYLYHILKYILYKNWNYFESKNIQLQTFSGSDFTMNQSFLPEQIFSRYLTMNFIARNSWRHSELISIDRYDDDPSTNTGPVRYISANQPKDGKYKVRADVSKDKYENTDDTLGLDDEDN